MTWLRSLRHRRKREPVSTRVWWVMPGLPFAPELAALIEARERLAAPPTG